MVEAVVIDQTGFKKAMRKAPQAMFRSLQQALFRHHTRFNAKMKRERLSGRPGLRAATGTLRRGLIVRREGSTLDSLAVTSAFSGAHSFFAHVHETGMTIKPKRGPFLIFPIRKGAAPSEGMVGAGNISRSSQIVRFVRARSVTIPPRLEFRKTFDSMRSELAKEVNLATHEALKGDGG